MDSDRSDDLVRNSNKRGRQQRGSNLAWRPSLAV